jgi:F-type H+-transporting ATPase subunit delta
MHQPRLAGRYAKSLLDLAVERNQLEAVYRDMQYIQSVCKQSREFVSLLRSPVFNPGKKQAVLDAVTKDKVSVESAAFFRLLVAKGREATLPEIAPAFIEQYNHLKGIHKVKLTTAEEVSPELRETLVSKIKSNTSLENIQLETAVDQSLIGGFILEFDNNLVDASIQRELKELKKDFQQNTYIQNIR